MKNLVQTGEVLNYLVPESTTINSGQLVFAGALVGVALSSSSTEGEIVAVNLEGVYKFDKATPLVISQGNRLYWNEGTSKLTKTVTDKFAGYAYESALSADTEVLLLLTNEGPSAPQAAVVAALVDNSGGAAADGTIAVVTVAAALVDNSGGAGADGTIGVLVDAGGTAAGAPTTASVADAIKELSTARNADRVAIIALKDAIAELAAKQNAHLASEKTVGLMAS